MFLSKPLNEWTTSTGVDSLAADFFFPASPSWETPPHFTGGGGLAFVLPGVPPVCALAFGLLSVGQEASHFLSRLLSAGGGRVFLRRAYSIVTLYRAAHLLPDPHQPSTADSRYLFPFRAESETPDKGLAPGRTDRLATPQPFQMP